MAFGYLTQLVATMPSSMAMGITKNELDIAPASGSAMPNEKLETSKALVKAFFKSAAAARAGAARDDRQVSHGALEAARAPADRSGVAALRVMIQLALDRWTRRHGQIALFLRAARSQSPVDLLTVGQQQAAPVIEQATSSCDGKPCCLRPTSPSCSAVVLYSSKRPSCALSRSRLRS